MHTSSLFLELKNPNTPLIPYSAKTSPDFPSALSFITPFLSLFIYLLPMTGKRAQTSPGGSPSPENISDASSKDLDRFLPIANVSRIMKKSLPANAKISKEAKETVQECVSEFISFITGEASDKCQREKRKTINGDDLLWAMTTLGFENYVGPLKVYLNKYRETEGEKNSMASRQEDIHGINSIDFHGATVGEISKPSTSSLQGFGEDDCYGKGYGENLVVSGGFNMGRIHQLGDGSGNGKRAMATHLHGGVEW